MNLPDVTFLFQMFHFVVAYALLRRFVFAPALEIIESDENKMEQMQNKVDAARDGHLNMALQQDKQWKFIQQSLIDMTPDVNQKVCRKFLQPSEKINMDEGSLSDQQKKAIKKILQDQLLDARR